MTATLHEPKRAAATPIDTIDLRREEHIAASPQVVYETILEQLGPRSEMGTGNPFPMVFEAFPGGRWFRDLGNGAGHLWGHVQVIKPPTLIEITGPLFMSYPAVNFVQYRLVADGEGTRLQFRHQGMGLIDPEHKKGVAEGWGEELSRIRELAEKKASR